MFRDKVAPCFLHMGALCWGTLPVLSQADHSSALLLISCLCRVKVSQNWECKAFEGEPWACALSCLCVRTSRGSGICWSLSKSLFPISQPFLQIFKLIYCFLKNTHYPLLHTVPIKIFACKCFWQTPLGSGHSSGWAPGEKKHAFWACLPWSHWADQPSILCPNEVCSAPSGISYWERELFLSRLLLSRATGDRTKMPQSSVFLQTFSPFCWFSASKIATSFRFVSSVPKKSLILTVFARVLVVPIEGWSFAVSYSDQYIDIILPIFFL